MSIVDEEPFLGREGGRKLYEDADKLLRLAEGLQEKCEQYEEKRDQQFALQGIIILFFTIPLVYLGFSMSRPGEENGVANVWFWLAVTAFYLYGVRCLIHMRLQFNGLIARERRAFHSVVDMLRDLEKGISGQDILSTLERAEFRIRLSRFDIGPGK